MKAALERGDVDEASRQGVLAGPAVVEAALASPDRTTVLAAIAAAPRSDDRAELLAPLAKVARGADRRTAIPAARAAAQIARELTSHEPADDIADADIVAWRDAWGEIALDPARWIEVRVLAADAAAYIERSRADGLGVPLATALADPDPAFRRAVLAHVPMPAPIALREALAKAVVADTDSRAALGAAAALCADLAFDPATPILTALGAEGIERIQSFAKLDGASPGELKAANRCLSAARAARQRP